MNNFNYQLIYIERGGRLFGPYDRKQLTHYIVTSQIMLNDAARLENYPVSLTVAKAMELCRWQIPEAPNSMKNLMTIGDCIFPFDEIRKIQWRNEKRFLLLAIIGLLPLLIFSSPFINGISVAITYIAIAAYFSVLWGLFFFFIFKTEQSTPKNCCICFLTTAFVSTVILLIIHATGILELAGMLSEHPIFIFRFIGMLLAAGLPEELCKAAVIFFFVRKKGVISLPQTIVLYGLCSGLGFGIHEGVLYQLGINREFGVDEAYLLNLLRLTSLPFLHAIWCGIASFFISFSALFPMNRHGLRCIAILLPAVLHALYNSMPTLLCPLPAIASVILFAIYITNAKNIGNKLQNQNHYGWK